MWQEIKSKILELNEEILELNKELNKFNDSKLEIIKSKGLFQKSEWFIGDDFRTLKHKHGNLEEALKILDPTEFYLIFRGGYECLEKFDEEGNSFTGEGFEINIYDDEFIISFANVNTLANFIKEFKLSVDWTLANSRLSFTKKIYDCCQKNYDKLKFTLESDLT